MKIRGSIEDMIAKPRKDVQEEAIHEAFSQEAKTAESDKYANRFEKAVPTIALLTGGD